MGVDAEELIVRPFREVVGRGNEAITNADDADDDDSIEQSVRDDLIRYGRALVREGERALKRLQPVWDGQVEKYGDAFKDAMLQQDDVERRRREVEDLLYDFEDYIEVRTFDGSKFAELQAATRSFALDAINVVRRLKLESPPVPIEKTKKTEKTTSEKMKSDKTKPEKSVFPPLPPLPPMPPMPPLPSMSGERRSRSSLMKQARMSAATSVTTEGDESPTSSNLRRANTKSSVATSYSSASLRSSTAAASAALADHADSHSERYQLYDHPEGYDASVMDDSVSIAPTMNTLASAAHTSSHAHSHMPPPPSTIPRTSAWVRSHQQLSDQQLSHQQLSQLQKNGNVRKKPAHDIMTPEYDAAAHSNVPGSPGPAPTSPSMQSRFSSLNIDGSVRSTYSSTYSPSSPVLTDGTRASYMSSAATSYTSSPTMNFSMPPLPADLASHAERINNLVNHHQAHYIQKDGMLPPPAMGRRQSVSSQSIQDFIKFAPSPPVPPIGLPLSPTHRPQIMEEEEHGHYDPHNEEDINVDDVEEMLRLHHQSRPGSRVDSSSHRRLDWKPRTSQGSPGFQGLVSPGSPGPGADRVDHIDHSVRSSSRQQRLVTPPPPINTSDIPDIPEDLLVPSDKTFDQGLMVAETQNTHNNDDTATIATTGGASDVPMTREFVREADCSIGPHSSFEQMGGFCKGAELFRTGGHWQGIKQTGGYVANKQASIGRCVGCGYAHNYDEVRLDIERKPEATFTKAGGARFRLRLLYKSHLSNTINSARQAESHYACIFCVHAGATVREGDATVFTTPDHLLLHLARHPQPLPIVPGVTVVYGEPTGAIASSVSSVSASTDPVEANDFDLHLVNPPLPTPVPPSIGQAAVATAVREHMFRWGGKKLARPAAYTGDMLHFLANARIVGVMFPEKWEGKWCVGWHDGFVGAFPAKAVQIEPPQHNEMPMAGSDSGMSVVTRWKWRPNDGKEKEKKKDDVVDDAASVWLSFDKGETISNVKCLYADHWCWAGTNSKGRFGVFPQSHILPKTIQQELLAPLRTVKTGGWTAKSLFKGSSGHGNGSRPRPASSSAASSLSSSTGRTRFT
ncbi:sh3 domain-containing protein [Ophiostoma piceae UAMH 11346]|uniref:Sh3 domain-containing protein n=1 Tax=Ophiostoma piceae (strain UAMH 11346) TaxID=1262450 RepID=S3BYP9_OPHP1|nr:sh3 domain-containing protein [Ophiostoma piceae UAMH 11346]